MKERSDITAEIIVNGETQITHASCEVFGEILDNVINLKIKDPNDNTKEILININHKS